MSDRQGLAARLALLLFVALLGLLPVRPAVAQAAVLAQPTLLATAPDGSVLVYDAPGRELVVFTAAGVERLRKELKPTRRSRTLQARDLSVTPAGEVLVLDRRDNAVHVFDLQGTFLRTRELAAPTAPPQFNSVVADAQGRWFVSSDGGILSVWNAAGSWVGGETVIDPATGADTPGKLAIDGAGLLYAVDRSNHRIVRLDTNGPASSPLVWRGWIGGCTAGRGCEMLPASANAPQPTIGRARAWCLSTQDCLVSAPGQGLGRLQSPLWVAAGAQGALLVSDLGGGTVQRFDGQGRFTGALGRRGTQPGEIGSGDATAIGPDGSIYVLQTTLGRVTKFAPDGSFVLVFGGGVAFSVAAVNGVTSGDIPGRALELRGTGAARAQSTAIAVLSRGGYAGPVAFGSPMCSTAATAPTSVPCSQLGLSAVVTPGTVSVASGQVATAAVSVSAAPAAPDGAVVMTLPSATPGLPAYVQLYLNVALDRRIALTAAPVSLTLMPGDAPATVALNLASVDFAGTLTLSGAFTPPPPAQHLSHRFLSTPSVTLAAGQTVQRTLEISALPWARTGSYTFNLSVGAMLRSPVPVSVTVDCDCRSTGDFVRPSVRPVSTTGATTGTSPDGNVAVEVFPPANGLPPRIRLARTTNPSVELVSADNPMAWGFSPDSRFFVLVTPGGASHLQDLGVYDLSGSNLRVLDAAIAGCPLGDPNCRPPGRFCVNSPVNACGGGSGSNTQAGFQVGSASWGFAPDSRSFVFAAVNPLTTPDKYSLTAWRLQPGVTPARQVVATTGPTLSSFWRFSPCGDLLMVFDQTSPEPMISGEAAFHLLRSGSPSAALERASLAVNAGMVALGPVGATVVPAPLPNANANGDFFVLLQNLVRQGSTNPPTNASNGFQSPQCRRP